MPPSPYIYGFTYLCTTYLRQIMMQSLQMVLIGYGKMGHAIEAIAQERGHQIVLTIDRGQEDRFDDPRFLGAHVAIEFTSPATAYDNCLRCLERGIPVVSGSTGWADQLPLLRKRCEAGEGTLFWSSNFSVGVNLFFRINQLVARLMNAAPNYALRLDETHHIHKLDAPSGTAITLAEGILAERPELTGWALAEEGTSLEPGKLPIFAHREGEVPGIHTTIYRSEVDQITLTHEAFGRQGFALGAVLAAEYASQHTGWLTMNDLLHLDNE